MPKNYFDYNFCVMRKVGRDGVYVYIQGIITIDKQKSRNALSVKNADHCLESKIMIRRHCNIIILVQASKFKYSRGLNKSKVDILLACCTINYNE